MQQYVLLLFLFSIFTGGQSHVFVRVNSEAPRASAAARCNEIEQEMEKFISELKKKRQVIEEREKSLGEEQFRPIMNGFLEEQRHVEAQLRALKLLCESSGEKPK